MDEDAREQWLRDRQDGRVYAVGQVLRATFDADNHDSLGSDVTGLMIDLSRVPVGAHVAEPVAQAVKDPAGIGRVALLAKRSLRLIGACSRTR